MDGLTVKQPTYGSGSCGSLPLLMLRACSNRYMPDSGTQDNRRSLRLVADVCRSRYMQNWLYEDGEDEKKSVYMAKLEEFEEGGRRHRAPCGRADGARPGGGVAHGAGWLVRIGSDVGRPKAGAHLAAEQTEGAHITLWHAVACLAVSVCAVPHVVYQAYVRVFRSQSMGMVNVEVTM